MGEGIDWQGLIRQAIGKEASDVHLTVGQRPHMRCDGVLVPMDGCSLTKQFMAGFCAVIMDEEQRKRLAQDKDIDLSWTFAGRRFRVNAYYQQGFLALAIRLLPEKIPSLGEIGAPRAWDKMKGLEQGLILVTGRTGSGKTTTLAAFIEALNQEKSYHIITLEDPVEFLYEPRRCFISQRELGRDFFSFSQALRSALREMPDVILVGEIRDQETMKTALMAAASGALVLGTLHTLSAMEAVMRIEGMFPLDQQDSIRAQVAEVLVGVFAQRLLPCIRGGRVCRAEVLLTNPAVQSLIRQGKYSQLESVMMSHQEQGMQTEKAACEQLCRAGLIARDFGADFRLGRIGG
ncbi:MAG: PilT/PilU family type 4a pilus ATPase [Selenomonas sp.]|uniref:type IV pilus twitching motility protein PilT n=1 Tax=Selenomonas sp. TaxID=2053611 RepID=UPI0025DE79C2|nr:PilT/PilU family type 4a pilus ATPase [Selenomonas sp.]MCR5439208.1 PilT/PilU family type 4a pilus ATPase [Selenomonas sp.]